MTCNKIKDPARGEKVREIIAGLFEQGNIKAAFKHRFNQCVHASDCGKLCINLVKGPGVEVWCADLEAMPITRVNLYDSLRDRDFRCPRGIF